MRFGGVKGGVVSTRPSTALVVLAIFLLAIVQRWFVVPNPDVAWLLTVAERMLGGERLYVDIVETNPPFSVWLHLSAALIGRLTGLRADVVWDAIVFLACGLSLHLTIGPLRRRALLDPPTLAAATIAMAAALLLLPANCFGQREHVALLAFLPIVAHAALRAQGHDLERAERFISALCICIVVAIKPHFGLAVAAVIGLACVARANWRILFAWEHLLGAALFLAYVGATFVVHPAFWTAAMPLNATLYLPVRYTVLDFLRHFFALEVSFVALLLLTYWKCRNGLGHMSTLLAAAACAFFIAIVVQGKGMAYHFYPALALAVIVPFSAGRARTKGLGVHRLAAVAFAIFFWTWFNSGFDFRGAVASVQRVAPHPRVLALGSDISIGPPVARAAGGVYVGRIACQWITDFATWLKARSPDAGETSALDAYVRQDREMFMEDLLTQKPDVLFVQRGPEDWMAWAQADPRFAPALADYERGETVESAGMRNAFVLTYDMWRRRTARP
jgi:hypothetical protein